MPDGAEEASLTGAAGKDALSVTTFLGSVTLSGAGGNDTLLGGAAADSLDGGDGNDVLDGQGGNDSLVGGNERDLLIGGMGADLLVGGNDQDLLIGGTTSHSGNTANITAIMAELTSTKFDYANRVKHLKEGTGGANGLTKLDALTVQNDGDAADMLFGNAELDWFFQSANDVLDAINGETVN
jgi:Ca2+-binding RTX toxin-like protein